MTTTWEEENICAVCEKTSKQTVIGSTNAFGSPDLDLRPPEMERSTIEWWIQTCPSCGYCARLISKLIGEAAEIVQSESYKQQFENPGFPKLANKFLCLSLIQEYSGDYAGAGWSSIYAAWVCDDAGATIGAQKCREKAVNLLQKAKENGQAFVQQTGADAALMVDLLRRSGQFEIAVKICDDELIKNTDSVIADILRFQKLLISKQDMACHSVEEAIGQKQPQETPSNGTTHTNHTKNMKDNECMDHINLLQEDQRRPMSKEYIDSKGRRQKRGSFVDFQTLPFRHKEVIFNLPGFSEDEEVVDWIEYAAICYDAGEYGTALQRLKWSLKKMPALEPYIYYYMRVCERVLSIPLTKEEMEYEAKLDRYYSLPKWLRWTMPGFGFHMLCKKWLRWTMPGFEFRIRCKWCGRYTKYIEPNVPTFGFATFANSCMSCGRMYPMPSWMWDSPDGRAYSYYRKSFSGEEFYDEFKKDYDP